MKSLDNINVNRIRKKSEKYYRKGDFYCSEAIVKSIKDEFEIEVTDRIISVASGLPVGIGGTGCACGAVTGGVIMLGLFFGRVRPGDKKVEKAMKLSAELQNSFAGHHNSLCCKILTKDVKMGSPKHMKQCIAFTGEVAQKTAEIIIREQKKK